MNGNTAILVDRAGLGLDVLRHSGPDFNVDYARLEAHLGLDDPCPRRHVWCLDAPPAAVSMLGRMGWEVHNLPQKRISGLIECEMAVVALCLPEHVTRVVLVSGSGALLPLVTELYRCDVVVTIAAHRGSVAVSLRDLPGVQVVHLDNADILAPKTRTFVTT